MVYANFVQEMHVGFPGAAFEIPAECLRGHVGDAGCLFQADMLAKVLHGKLVDVVHAQAFPFVQDLYFFPRQGFFSWFGDEFLQKAQKQDDPFAAFRLLYFAKQRFCVPPGLLSHLVYSIAFPYKFAQLLKFREIEKLAQYTGL